MSRWLLSWLRSRTIVLWTTSKSNGIQIVSSRTFHCIQISSRRTCKCIFSRNGCIAAIIITSACTNCGCRCSRTNRLHFTDKWHTIESLVIVWAVANVYTGISTWTISRVNSISTQASRLCEGFSETFCGYSINPASSTPKYIINVLPIITV